ncbi:nicotinate-nucleotide adenylyltransferase [Rheinheimera pacifica]|uniref:Probable nicotinate-nucleotide adenylyltransferase n=1 Tax=Rheinheimera pacifica TaxID=173990 RepID=A0A1H6MPH1_9GAMM|nr:nicotinate-nucleotide adenylyltransferase [Rheinheimera pacifica]SEI01359.1 nicotinate-nucleotide adenylyltransferase [Rheinheimera pacifica]
MIKHIGILGGTFDPVHNGHIRCAHYVQQHCALDEVRLMPCHLPAHRATPGVSSEQRAAMVQLAISQYPQLKLERLELNKPSASYTADSLQLLSTQEPGSRFYFIIGMDSLCYFRSWKNWPDILKLAHLLVCQRPGYSQQDGDAPALLQQFGVTDLATMRQRPSGCIMLLANPLADISASEIRRQLQQQQSAAKTLDPAVLNYIQTQQLYQA